MKNKTKIFLVTFVAVAGASQLCVGCSNIHTLDDIQNTNIKLNLNKFASIFYDKPTLTPKAKMVMFWVRRIVNGLEYVDQYSHGAIAAFALFGVAPWLASKGRETEAGALAAGTVCSFGTRLLGDWGQSSFKAWAKKVPDFKEYSEAFKFKYPNVYPLPFFAIQWSQMLLRMHLVHSLFGSIASGRFNQKEESRFDKGIILGGLALQFFDAVHTKLFAVRSMIDIGVLKVFWPLLRRPAIPEEKRQAILKELNK